LNIFCLAFSIRIYLFYFDARSLVLFQIHDEIIARRLPDRSQQRLRGLHIHQHQNRKWTSDSSKLNRILNAPLKFEIPYCFARDLNRDSIAGTRTAKATRIVFFEFRAIQKLIFFPSRAIRPIRSRIATRIRQRFRNGFILDSE